MIFMRLRQLLKKIFHSTSKESITDYKGSKVIEGYDVFISKKTEDSDMAMDVCSFLECNGFKCFISERELPSNGNANYYQTIDEALEHSTNLVVVCSKAEYLNSKWVQHEWQAFSNELLSSHRSGNIITIRGDKVVREDIPFTLRNLELLDWHNYKDYLLAFIVREDNSFKKSYNSTNNQVLGYSDAFMLGIRIGDYGLKSVGGKVSNTDIREMNELLEKWNLPKEKIEPLLQPGKGMAFLNGVIDIFEEKWGDIYGNCTYLGTTYIFCMLAKKRGDAESWNEKIINICQKIGIPKHIYIRISTSDADGMIVFRDAVRSALDNLDNSVKKCPCCGGNIGFDYDKCPKCGIPIKKE